MNFDVLTNFGTWNLFQVFNQTLTQYRLNVKQTQEMLLIMRIVYTLFIRYLFIRIDFKVLHANEEYLCKRLPRKTLHILARCPTSTYVSTRGGYRATGLGMVRKSFSMYFT